MDILSINNKYKNRGLISFLLKAAWNIIRQQMFDFKTVYKKRTQLTYNKIIVYTCILYLSIT